MIIESPAALKLFATLTEIGAAGTTREHLIRKAEISTSSFYRLVGPLIEDGLVNVDGSRYSLAFDNLYCFRFKLWHDMERLYRLPPNDRDMALGVTSGLLANAENQVRCLWLVGSAARAELAGASDLDFLLVTDKEQVLLPAGRQSREINVIQMSTAHFRDLYRQADAFVVSALQTGIVLFDSGFAQSFYVSPPPVRITANHARAQEAATGQHRELLLTQLRQDDIDGAQRTLKNQATSVGLLLLRAMEILPTNRHHLIEQSEIMFGKAWSATLASALLFEPDSKDDIVALSRRIADQQASFGDQAEHLQRFSALPKARERTLEQLGERVFRELIPDGRIDSDNQEVDLCIAAPGLRYKIEFKSTAGVASEELLRKSVKILERAKSEGGNVVNLVLVINPHTKLPTSEFSTSEAAIALYKKAIFQRLANRDIRDRLAVLSGVQLLRAHNRYHLEDLPPLQVLNELLQEGNEASITNEAVAARV